LPGIEGIPLVAAGATPAIILAGDQPKRGSGYEAGRCEAFVLLRLAIQNDGLIIRDGTSIPFEGRMPSKIEPPVRSFHRRHWQRGDLLMLIVQIREVSLQQA
jgi:hypothetical protein